MIKLTDILNEGQISKCPPATQNIELNLKNRQKGINEYGYGPLNPNDPNEKFWQRKVDMWQLDSVEEAKEVAQIKKVTHVDRSYEGIGFIYQKGCTVVHGN
jgi:hypothetical protein